MEQVIHYPSWVICIDNEPLIETDGSITLYQEGSDEELKERFFSIVYLSKDSSNVTIKKYQLTPHSFEDSISSGKFMIMARETHEIG